MAISLGSLVAELSANTASFQKDMGKAAAILNSHAAGMNRTVAGIQKSISGIGTAFTAVLSATAVLGFSKKLLEMGDQFATLSEKSGVSVEKLSEFAYGAKLGGTSVEQMAGGLKKLAVNMADAAANGGGQLAGTFRALGIAVTDSNGNLRDTASVFEDLAKKFAGAKDGPEKVAFAVKLMGESGENLIPLLNDLSKTSDEARRLGLVMSGEAAQNAKAFLDQMTRLATQFQVYVLPSLTAVTKAVRAIFGSEDLDILMGKRAKAAQEYSQLIDAGMSKNSARIVLLLQQIDQLDAKIIESNKRLAGSGGTTDKITLPNIVDTGQAASFQRLLHDMQKAAAEANAAMTLDDQQRSNERLAIAAKEFTNKGELLKLTGNDLLKFNAQLSETMKALSDKAAHDLRSPLQKLTDDWGQTTKQLEAATAKWAQSSVEALTDFVTTGKADFKGFADSVIRDLVRIFIQQQVIGSFKTKTSAGTGLLGLVGGLFGYADGGNPPVGKPYIVGENGPEVRIDRSPSTIIPNAALSGGGGTYIIDARGADREGMARLEKMIRQVDGSIEQRSVSAWLNDRSRGGATARFA